MLKRLGDAEPAIAPDVYVANGAVLIGKVSVGSGASVWFNAVLRGDTEPIRIGQHSNVQDNCTLHADPGYPCTVGDYVTIGHGAVVHGCTIEENVLIGMNATVLNGATIGRDSIVGAGALVPENTTIPPGSLVVGLPGRVLRALRPEEVARIRQSAESYAARAARYREGSPRPTYRPGE